MQTKSVSMVPLFLYGIGSVAVTTVHDNYLKVMKIKRASLCVLIVRYSHLRCFPCLSKCLLN